MRRELALAALILAGCEREPPATAATAPAVAAPAPGAPGAATVLASAELYRIELRPPAPCAVGAACAVELVLHALGEFKVNAEYPHKLVVEALPGLSVEGPGTFVVTAPRTGVLTVQVRAAAPGPARITGTFKLSVCTDEVCKIEAPTLSFTIPVT